ncbi:hypothetical protein JCM5296_003216 [Sporobolomyces johnsonii]
MSDPTRKLTKKEKKALSFRQNKGKAKKVDLAQTPFDEATAVPEQEDLNAAERDQVQEGATPDASKKRKRDDADDGAKAQGEGDEEQPKKKKRQRGKKKSQQGQVGEDGQPRLLLFVGNLPYKVTVDDIKKHFEPCGEIPTVRLLTPKPTSTSSSTSAPASKGCAFLQFASPSSLQSALRLHHSTLLSRKINVELTAGGGGNSEARRQKISEQRAKLEREREKAAKNKRVREGEGEDGDKTGRWKLAAEKLAAKGETGEGEASVEGQPKKKVRDRRNKPGAAGGEGKVDKERKRKLEARAEKASSGANAIRLASGWPKAKAS